MPGMSSWKRQVLGNYHDYDTKRSAGVDCSGYIQRCASYENNPYTVNDLTTRVVWGGGSQSLIGPQGFASNEYTWPIADRNCLIIDDIISCDGHVVMVWKIVYDDNLRNVIPDNVHIIEAAGAGMMVRMDRDWQDLRNFPDDFTNITLKRIIID